MVRHPSLARREKVAERFLEIRARIADVGRHRALNHFKGIAGNPARQSQRLWVQMNLEGVDCFFDGVPADGHNDSKTFFGKM